MDSSHGINVLLLLCGKKNALPFLLVILVALKKFLIGVIFFGISFFFSWCQVNEIAWNMTGDMFFLTTGNGESKSSIKAISFFWRQCKKGFAHKSIIANVKLLTINLELTLFYPYLQERWRFYHILLCALLTHLWLTLLVVIALQLTHLEGLSNIFILFRVGFSSPYFWLEMLVLLKCQSILVTILNRYFAVGSADSLVSLWDIKEMLCVRTFTKLE